VISWQVNLRQGTRFWVAPHGPIQQGEVVGVELGGAGADCLGIGTRTASEPFVTYDGNAYQSVQNQLNAVSTRFPNQMTTSPEAGLPTRLAAAGVIVWVLASVLQHLTVTVTDHLSPLSERRKLPSPHLLLLLLLILLKIQTVIQHQIPRLPQDKSRPAHNLVNRPSLPVQPMSLRQISRVRTLQTPQIHLNPRILGKMAANFLEAPTKTSRLNHLKRTQMVLGPTHQTPPRENSTLCQLLLASWQVFSSLSQP